MAEILGRNIKKLVKTRLWKGAHIHKSIDSISHSQFADDTILFGEATEKEAKVIKMLLNDYEKGSGQSMNKEKSMIYFFNTNERMQCKIGEIMGYLQGKFPLKYLGVQLDPGRHQNKMWEEVINKCQVKASSWKNKWLTQAGRIQMIKYVLSAIPIYQMSCFRLSFKVAKELDSLFKKFLWDGAQEKKKNPLINWDTTFLLKMEGGAGLRKMDLHNLALGAKLAWKMYAQPHKSWCKIMAAKSIITEHLTWKIGNGGKAKFWRDSWNGDIPLVEEIDDTVWVNEVDAVVGSYVADYIMEGQRESEWIEWKLVGEWKMEKNVELKDILNRKKKIIYQKEED
ncbi:uncharacterized protein LOC131052243 [Cryptomeria japonica]|uniref:uncharacterized protein LOC131052243 n=1 Tax=Cryptomeria japonica TaxID=3369 RepID=UPI0027DA59F7|nr:uncharacterized protein LOC131052243 [Cryptomeria japonica]